jgi:hypothetical protein
MAGSLRLGLRCAKTVPAHATRNLRNRVKPTEWTTCTNRSILLSRHVWPPPEAPILGGFQGKDMGDSQRQPVTDQRATLSSGTTLIAERASRCMAAPIPRGADMVGWPESDLDLGELRVGTWNLDRDKPRWRQPHQEDHISNQADLWLLTEVPANWQFGTANSSFSGSRPDEDDQYWSEIICSWPIEPIITKHPSLAMARIDHPGKPFLVAASVFPWRGAAEFWPTGDGDTFAERCVNTLDAHAAEICEARYGLPVVWGGDFNQALSGRDYVGSDAGRAALSKAFKHLGLRAVTVETDGQIPPHQSIDHLAIPQGWGSGTVEVRRHESDGRFLSDHPSYVVSVKRTSGFRP